MRRPKNVPGVSSVSRLFNIIVLACTLALSTVTAESGDALSAGHAAYRRGDYARAAPLLLAAANRGEARAQALLGFMYANGRGVPQSYPAAVYWYKLAAEQGDVTAQYLLGLMYDKGQGVPFDAVAAYKWLNLAAARAPKREREYYFRLRDAVASKLTRGQIAEGQWRALEWDARPRY